MCAALGFLAFVSLWVVGIVRGMSRPYPPPTPWPVSLKEELSQRMQAANNLAQIGLAKTNLPLILDQPNIDLIEVYEKTALLSSGSVDFEADERRLRRALADRQAVILNEKNNGIAPERRLMLEVGVNPEQFDALVEQLLQIGHLKSINVTRHDRTSEFRKLHAQRQSLKKYLESVVKLRAAKEPSIDATLKVEQKIQEIEKELQSLSGQLGELLGKESLYHVNVTLYEYQPGDRLDRSFTMAQNLFYAGFWASAWWLASIIALGFFGATVVSIYVFPRPSVANATTV